MRFLTICVFACCVHAGGTFARAEATGPATTPAVVLDQSTPKALLRSFFVSRGEVDEATLRSLLHAATPLEQKILDSLVQVELANGRLRAAQRERFGSATTAPSVAAAAQQRLDLDTAEDIDALSEKIEGDRAILSSPMNAQIRMELIRVDGKWKLPIAAQAGPVDPATGETLGAATRAQVEIIDAVATDVRAGRFTSEEQVRQELARRFEERLASATRPASPSSTRRTGT